MTQLLGGHFSETKWRLYMQCDMTLNSIWNQDIVKIMIIILKLF